MLTSIKVTGFRALQSLEAKDLGRVNLLVGKNNAGKTSLLEAIYLGLDSIKPWAIRVVMQQRGEAIGPITKRLSEETIYPILPLFNKPTSKGEIPFSIEGEYTDHSVLKCSCCVNANRLGLQITNETKPASHFIPFDPTSPQSAVKDFNLGIVVGDPEFFDDRDNTPVRFVPNTSLTPEEMNFCWADITLTPEEDAIIRALQMIDSDIQRINFSVNTINKSDIMALHAKLSKIPFSYFGDGVCKILAMFLALIRSKNGYFLIDEIDTGLHYSVMQKMWEMVIETAKRLNIQVFATTHSLDCIRALAWLQEEKPELCEEVRLHQMKKDAKKTQSFDAEAIQRSVESLSELR